MVGFEEHLERIMDQLTAHESDLQILPITGMGALSYSIQDVVLGLLGELDNKNNSKSKQDLPELEGQLYQMLFGKRYLIVMDDVWGTEIWDELRLFFPNNKSRSRIVVTTRLLKVADSLGSQNPYLMDFLDEKKSWNLFCIKVFGKEVCPNPELEKIGKSTVECCKGLPLEISVIGGLLRKSNTIEDWDLVAKNVMKSLANSKDDEDCSNILSLSYRHLSIHLKPCFLYMRVFDEGEMFEVDRLVNYWIAEGFVKPKGGKTLEEVASEYLKDLINRNLILIHEFDRHSGDVCECKVHDLLRDLCIREYEKEHVFCISKVGGDYYQSKSTCFLCRSPAYKIPHQSSIKKVAATPVFCFVCEACNARLVMTRDDFRVHYQHTRLRYLETRKWESDWLPLLWNLQFLKSDWIDEPIVGTLMEMPQLRHLYVEAVSDVDPPVTEIGCREDCVILEDLQTLSTAMNLRCSEEIFKRIPNVKSLTIYGEQPLEVAPPVHPFHNLVDLHKLETLVCSYVNLEYISFPNTMKILNLMECCCSWERMTIIGSLPNLEVLELMATRGGPEWNPIGEFLELKTLSIVHNDLVRWRDA